MLVLTKKKQQENNNNNNNNKYISISLLQCYWTLLYKNIFYKDFRVAVCLLLCTEIYEIHQYFAVLLDVLYKKIYFNYDDPTSRTRPTFTASSQPAYGYLER